MKNIILLASMIVLLCGSTLFGQISNFQSSINVDLIAGNNNGELSIEGPDTSKVGQYAHLRVFGLPPVDTSKTLDESLQWLKTLAMRVQQPPESSQVDFDVTLGFDISSFDKDGKASLAWKLTMDLKATVPGDYVVVFAMPSEDSNENIRIAMHRVRFIGDVPPEPDPSMQITPEEPFGSHGPSGGPFDPDSISYTITNVGEGVLNWSVNFGADWLSVSPSSGQLNSGQSTQVHVAINDAANALKKGTYADVLNFINNTNGKGSAPRLVALTVEGSPIPPPPPPVSELWGIVIYESADIDDYGAEVAKILASQEIRSINKFHFLIFDDDIKDKSGQVPEKIKPLINAVNDNNLEEPHLFLIDQDGNLVYNTKLPDNISATIELIKKYLPDN